MDTRMERYTPMASHPDGMAAEKTCRYCYGTGMIQCTTGWDGEMAVSCSCRQEGSEDKEDFQGYIRVRQK